MGMVAPSLDSRQSHMGTTWVLALHTMRTIEKSDPSSVDVVAWTRSQTERLGLKCLVWF